MKRWSIVPLLMMVAIRSFAALIPPTFSTTTSPAHHLPSDSCHKIFKRIPGYSPGIPRNNHKPIITFPLILAFQSTRSLVGLGNNFR